MRCQGRQHELRPGGETQHPRDEAADRQAIRGHPRFRFVSQQVKLEGETFFLLHCRDGRVDARRIPIESRTRLTREDLQRGVSHSRESQGPVQAI